MSPIVAQPSIAWEEVEQSLIDWAQDMTGFEAIWVEENGPQPTRPYVSLDWLVPPSGVGEDHYVDTYDATTRSADRELQGVRRGMLTVQVHTDSSRAGESAMAQADKLINSLVSDEVILRYFAPVRMASWGNEPMRKGNWLEDGKSVNRAAFDMRLGFSAGVGTVSERVGVIASVGLTGTINTAATAFEDAIAVTS